MRTVTDALPPEMGAGDGVHKTFIGGKWRAEKEVESKPQEMRGNTDVVLPGPPVELDANIDDTRTEVHDAEEDDIGVIPPS